jgi:hypothetical protein
VIRFDGRLVAPVEGFWMAYYFAKTINTSFDQAVEKVVSVFKSHDFGGLSKRSD